MRTYIRHERKVDGVRSMRVYRPIWDDPFDGVQGSLPEKMVMAELARRGVMFLHTPQTNNLGGAVDPTWEPDFLLPQHKIWIEVQGSYFHSMKGQIALDAFRYAAIAQRGWTPLFWWEFDILYRLQDLMNAVPELYAVNRPLEERTRRRYGRTDGMPFKEAGGVGLDHLKGLRTRNAARRKPVQMTYRRRRQGERKEK